MAERPGELNSTDRLDPVSRTAGAGDDEFLERYAEDDTELREFDSVADETPQETEQIKAQIVETRSQMGETIDAIQERLSIANIQEQVSETVSSAIESAKDTAYDATIGKAVNFMKNVGDGVTHSGAFKTVKNNPFPLALIGLGTGLLVYQSYSRKGSYRRGNVYGQDRRLYGSGEAGSFESGRSSAGTTPGLASSEGITDKAGAALGSVGTAVSNTAGSAYDSVTGAVTNVYSSAGDVAGRAYDRAGEYGQVVQEKYDEYLEENPLALGALAVAVGAAVGFAIPSTRYEGKLMGEAREKVMERAQEAAGTLVDKAKQVASDAGQTIKEGTQSLTQ